MKMYLVGGAVRDKLMGKTPKDFDFSVVLEPGVDLFVSPGGGSADFFESMMANLTRDHGVTFFPGKAQRPEHFTAKGKFPKGHKYSNKVAEFVLARKEGPYRDGRRPEFVEIGTLDDDLARRDFTMNAIAEDMDGNLIDPFLGGMAIDFRTIKTVGDAKQKFAEDALRVLRALRFSVTMGFALTNEIKDAMRDPEVLAALHDNISDERKMDELNKMFQNAGAIPSIIALNNFPGIMAATFGGKVNMEATMKQKGFN